MSSDVDMVYDYDFWLKRQWTLEQQKANIEKANAELKEYRTSRQLPPSYVFNIDIDRRLNELAVKTKQLDSFVSAKMNEFRTLSASVTNRTLAKQEIQRINVQKTLELQQRINDRKIPFLMRWVFAWTSPLKMSLEFNVLTPFAFGWTLSTNSTSLCFSSSLYWEVHHLETTVPAALVFTLTTVCSGADGQLSTEIPLTVM